MVATVTGPARSVDVRRNVDFKSLGCFDDGGFPLNGFRLALSRTLHIGEHERDGRDGEYHQDAHSHVPDVVALLLPQRSTGAASISSTTSAFTSLGIPPLHEVMFCSKTTSPV